MTINIAEFEAVLPDAEAIRTAADSLRTTVSSINSTAAATASVWARLQGGVYDVPGQERVFSAFLPVTMAAEDLASDADKVHSATSTYADAVDALKVRLGGVKADAAAFAREVDGRPQDEWDDDEGLVEKELGIIGALDQLFADLQAAQRDCANTISGIYGGLSYVETTETGPAANQVAYGYSKEQLDAAAAAGDLPWGRPTEWDKPWYRDVGDGIASFGKGLWSGVTGTVTGLGNMVGLNGGEAFKQTWAGLGKLAVNVAIVTSPLAQVALRASGNGDVVDRAGEELLVVGKAAIHWDEWQSDPAYAAGATTFDLASILLTAGAGATAKVGSVAGKVATVGNAAGKAGVVVRVTGAGKVAAGAVKATDFIQGVKVSTVTIAKDVGRTTIGTVSDIYQAGAVRVGDTARSGITVMNDAGDRIVNAVSPQPALASAGGVSARPGVLLNAVETHTGSRGGATTSGDAPSSSGSSGSSSSSNLPEEFRKRNEGRYGQTVDQQPTPMHTDADLTPDTAAGTGAAEASRSSSPETSARTQVEGAAGTKTPTATPDQGNTAGRSPGAATPDRSEAPQRTQVRSTADDGSDIDSAGRAPETAGVPSRSGGEQPLPSAGAAGSASATPEPATKRPATSGNVVPEHREPAPDATRPTTELETPVNARTDSQGTNTDAVPAESARRKGPEGAFAGGERVAGGGDPSDANTHAGGDNDRGGVGADPADDRTAGAAGDPATNGSVAGPDDAAGSTSHFTLTPSGWDNVPPKVEVDEAGNPVRLIFSDGEHRVAYSNDHLGDGGRDIMEHVQPALERHGRDVTWLKDIVQREASDSLSVADMEALLDVRRSIPALTDHSSIQKVLSKSDSDALLGQTSPYPDSILGYVTDAGDTRALLTPSKMYRALRLDYDLFDANGKPRELDMEERNFRGDDNISIRAVRFSSESASVAKVPDEVLVRRIAAEGGNASVDPARGGTSAPKGNDKWPNTGHGFTASNSVEHPIIAEYKISTPVKMEQGAEMWEMSGDSLPSLVGIFDGGQWRSISVSRFQR